MEPRKTKSELRKARVLRPVNPNAGIAAEYQRRVLRLLNEMHASVLYWVRAANNQNPSLLAQDETPAAFLRRTMKKLQDRWFGRFDDLSENLGKWFAQSVDRRSTDALKKILRDGGFTVEFKVSPFVRDVVTATRGESVGLIKSIPQRYLQAVEGAVMRAVMRGGDLGPLAKELQHTYGVTKKRAALIARDQNNKATAAITRARQIEAGIKEAQWMHSSAGKVPRPSHLKAGRDKVRYDVKKGWFDPDEGRNIYPGELINCRCRAKPIIPGFE